MLDTHVHRGYNDHVNPPRHKELLKEDEHLREKVTTLLSPWARHVLQPPVLCSFFFFWGAGKSLLWSCWIPISGLSPVAAKSAFLLGFHCTYCLISYRLHGHWGHPESRSSVKGKGQKAKMDCVPIKGYMNIYWYRKKPEGAFEFLVYLKNQDIVEDTEVFQQRFLAPFPQNSPCSLEINSTEAADSALYFCASSQSTVLHVSSS